MFVDGPTRLVATTGPEPRVGGRVLPKHGSRAAGENLVAGVRRPAPAAGDVYDAWDQILGETLPPPGPALAAIVRAAARARKPAIWATCATR
mmetsp:Transcript_14092/g.43547  ORF Transcript_14092/g.43547 Transcript_14092/m.43547 type:complete len:92 (-) Transcript_14092:223-498(-)